MADAPGSSWRCSRCQRVFVNDDWQRVEAAIEALGPMVAPVFPTITHGICPTCHAEMEETLSNLREKP